MAYSDENEWGLSPLEVLLAFLFVAVVFVAYKQDNTVHEKTKHARAVQKNNLNNTIQNKTESNAMNKVDSLFHYLEQRVGEGTSVSSPALTTDQRRYFHQVMEYAQLRKQHYEFTDTDKKHLLRAASITYSEVEALAAQLNDAAADRALYSTISEKFGISEAACQDFATQASSLGDWAFFIEKQLE